MSAIRLDHLDVRFGDVHAVRDASFAVAAGESFGIVGESGSGKSTVLRALAGLNPDWTGDMEILGERQGRRRPRGFYAAVQMVFQDPFGSLHPRQTVDRALAEPLAIHGIGDAEARIERALTEVQLGAGFRFRYPHQLSGGQRQRVAIARALILEPKILLLDEPTSALDVSIQAEVLNLLAELRRRLGLTFVLVSHNLAVVAHMCERIAVMNAGRIVEELTTTSLRAGTPREAYTRQLLLASRGYDRAAAAQFQTYD
ncbi:MAG: ABC transporter ATP-binding protein [Alphaproteobacteria bacterium]|nr:ABC transporter ATP-binding protein [Alphaproteobacteria bacterium]